MTSTKSAIRECKDQLFLDRADDIYLSRVSSNVSIDRPQFGFHNDSLWRALVRRGALDYLQVANLFRDWLDVILGPQKTVTSVLAQNAAVADDFLMVADPWRLPKRGVVVVNEGQITEKTFVYTFVDPLNGKMELASVCTDVLLANIAPADGTLLSDALIGATSLTLRQSEISLFPIAGFPMTLLLDAGKDNEEVVQLTDHVTYNAPLTVSALTKDHYGPTASPTNAVLQAMLASGTVLQLDDTGSFPNSGLIRLTNSNGGVGPTELIEYYQNDAANNQLYLSDKLQYLTYTIGTAIVTLMVPGSTVQLAQLQVKGIDWDVFQTEARTIYIYIPKSVRPNRILDASYLHDTLASTPSTTVASGASIGDTTLTVTDASGFPTAGSILINSGGGTEELIGYNRIDRYQTRLCSRPVKATGTLTAIAAALINDTETFTLKDGVNPPKVFEFDKGGGVTPPNVQVDITTAVTAEDVRNVCLAAIATVVPTTLLMQATALGTTQIALQNYRYGATGNQTQSETVTDPGFVLTNMTGGSTGVPAGVTTLYVEDAGAIAVASGLTKQLILGRGTANVEVVTWSSIDTATNVITLVSATANVHATLELCEVSNPNVLHLTRGLAKAHLASEAVALNEAVYTSTRLEIGDPTVAPAYDYRFQGHYMYYPGNLGRRESSYETVLAEGLAGPAYLLVDQRAGYSSLEILDALLFNSTADFSVTVGRRKGSEETVETSGVTLRRAVTEAGITVGTGSGIGDTVIYLAAGWSALPHPAGGAPYGYRLLIDPGGANEELVLVREVVGNEVTLVVGATIAHLVGEVVTLAADVIQLSGLLDNDHRGIIRYEEKLEKNPENFRPYSTVNMVEELRTYIKLTDVSALPTVLAEVIFNFGNRLVAAENKLAAPAAAGSTILSLYSTAAFPAANFTVEINVGFMRERRLVLTNNVGLGQLNLATGVEFLHSPDTTITFTPGAQTVFEYTRKASSPDRILFEDGIYLETTHTGEVPVVLNCGESEPIDSGTDYPLVMPTSWDDMLKFLFDWGRAAGVQVIVIDDR